MTALPARMYIPIFEEGDTRHITVNGHDYIVIRKPDYQPAGGMHHLQRRGGGAAGLRPSEGGLDAVSP